jgi:siroheme synthase (precorrin-2 oxidase/ferrochelatase)
MKHLIVGKGSRASRIVQSLTAVHEAPIVFEEHTSINEGLPQLVQNIIESADLTQYQELTTPLSGREKRRERRKQNRKK